MTLTYPKPTPLPRKWHHNFDIGEFLLLPDEAPEGYAWFLPMEERDASGIYWLPEKRRVLYSWGSVTPSNKSVV